MIINTDEWNEYIADDVPPGKIPEGIHIEALQIVMSTCYKEPPLDGYPTGLRADVVSVKARLFWRVRQ